MPDETEASNAVGASLRTLRIEREEGVATVIMARPARLNALDGDLRRHLRDALVALGDDDSVRAVVLTGEGRAFSSGSDIDAMGETDSRRVLLDEYRPIILALRSIAKPVIAAVHGIAAGAGVSVAMACDLVVIGESATLELSFIRLGLIPDAGLAWHLVRAIGRMRTAELSWTAGSISARQAIEWGIANRIVPDGTELAAARSLAAELAAGPAAAIGASKRLLETVPGSGLDALLQEEADAQAVLREGPEHAALATAWRSRRRERASDRRPD